MTRENFIEHACATGLRATRNEAERREHVADLKATAEAMADALGLQAMTAQLEARAPEGLRLKLGAAEDRIRELEAQLMEQATAPAPKPTKGGSR